MFGKDIFNIIELNPLQLWTLAEIKNYLRISHDYDDEIIKSLITSAIDMAENFLGLSLNVRKIEFINNNQNRKNFYLKFNPISKILKVSLKEGENEKELDEKEYYFDKTRSLIHLDKNLRGYELKIIFIAGYDDGKVPYSIKQGVLMHICEMYDRENDNCPSLSNEIKSLYSPYKKIKI